ALDGFAGLAVGRAVGRPWRGVAVRLGRRLPGRRLLLALGRLVRLGLALALGLALGRLLLLCLAVPPSRTLLLRLVLLALGGLGLLVHPSHEALLLRPPLFLAAALLGFGSLEGVGADMACAEHHGLLGYLDPVGGGPVQDQTGREGPPPHHIDQGHVLHHRRL